MAPIILPLVLAVSGATLGFAFALLSLALARAPGWHGLRWFAVAAASAGALCACGAAQLVAGDDAAVILGRVALSMAAIHAAAWVPYSGVGPRTLARVLQALALAIAGLALVPGVLLGRVVLRSTDSWTHSEYINVPPTALGIVSFIAVIGLVGFPLARYGAQWRAGVAGAGAHVLALGGLVFTGVLEASGSAALHAWPRLIPTGLVAAVVAVGCSLARRFVQSAQAYQTLSEELDATVEQRTAELSRVQEKNLQLESLAALGSLSAAVAHEINNPAAAAGANVQYLMDRVTEGGPTLDTAEVLRDTSESIDRVARIVQQLTLAGDRARRSSDPAPVDLSDTIRWAAADAQPELPAGVTVSLEAPKGLHARTLDLTLRQVLKALVVSAADAMRAASCSGRIRMQAAREGDRIVVRVVDPCPAPDAAQLARRLDAFLSPRPAHVARTKGLAVSVALLRIFGATLKLERGDAEGTTMCVELPAAEAPPVESRSPVSSRAPRARVLLVDDDVLVRIGLRRLLGREYSLVEAGSVGEAIACVREDPGAIDAIVCDLVMPDGGAQALLDELAATAPELMSATVLLTGGAVDDDTRALLEAHVGRVLRKPVAVDEVRAMIQRVRRRPAEGSVVLRSFNEPG